VLQPSWLIFKLKFLHLAFHLVRKTCRQPPTTELHFYDLPTNRPSGFVKSAVSEDLSCGIGSRLGEANFRFARQPPTIVTWAELPFYDLPLICPSGFINSAGLSRVMRDGRGGDSLEVGARVDTA
jgi:hypothetical protein